MKKWQLQEAKNRLSEVVRKAAQEGPQVITVHGDEVAVVVAADTFRKMTAKPREGLVAFFQKSPWARVQMTLERSRDTGRKVDL